jgi:predicted signal transduction protein with EAL and GGDEF domain
MEVAGSAAVPSTARSADELSRVLLDATAASPVRGRGVRGAVPARIDRADLDAPGVRIRTCTATPFRLRAGGVRIGASVGTALGHPREAPCELVARADRHMCGAQAHMRRRRRPRESA